MTTPEHEKSPCQGAGYRGTENRHQTVSTHGDNNSSPATDAVSAADFAKDTELDYFSAPNKNTKFWTVGTITWGELIELAQNPDDRKECGQYVLGRFKTRRRSKAGLRDRCALALDVDAPKPGFLVDARLELDGTAAIIHTTYSSTVDKPRYRIIIPLTKRVDADTYTATVNAMIDRLASDDKSQFDPSSDQAERYMYKPSTQDLDHYTCEVWDGAPLEPSAPEEDAETSSEDEQTVAKGTGDTTPFDDLSEEQQEAAWKRTKDRIEGLETRLAAAVGWGENERDEQDRGWEGLTRDLADTLHRLVVSPWCPLSEADAEDEFHRVLPPEIAEAESEGAALKDKWKAKRYGSRARGPLPSPQEETRKSAERDFDPNTLPSGSSESEDDSEDAPDDLTALYEETADLLDAAGVLRPQNRATDQVKLTMISELARTKAREMRTQSERARLRPVIPVGRSMADPMPEEIPDLLGGLLPYEGRANMFAAYKGGKTSTVVNLIWSLTTGQPYLGRFPLERGPLKVALLDTEMTEGTLRSWLTKRGVDADGEQFQYWILRGAVSSFDPLDDDNRAQWAELLAPFDFIILDNLRPSLDALGLDENSEIGKYLTHFDMLVKEAGAVGSMIVHHAGHADNGRGRGDSAFMASNDVFISLSTGDVKGADVTSQTPRYFSARGRLGDVPRSRVVFDPDTVTVKLAGQNDDPAPPAWNDVKELLRAAPTGRSETNLYDSRGDNNLLTRGTIKSALNWAMNVGLVEKNPAGGKGHVYALTFGDDEPLDED